jgi:hypothetical protein
MCDDQPKKVKIVLSLGLVVFAACCAVSLVVAQRVLPPVLDKVTPAKQQYKPGGVSYDNLQSSPLQTLPINEKAASEVKRGECLLCQTQQSKQPQPTQPQQPQQIDSTPTNSRYNVATFVGTDAASQRLLKWFDTDPKLKKLRDGTNYQAYTKDNPIYKARFSDVIPANQFPAVMMTDNQGGHVYVAGYSSLPSTPDALHSAMREAYTLQKQIREQANAIESSSRPDCVDGNCKPADRQPLINPDREPLFPALRPRDNPVESILYWLWNPGEALLAMCCALVFVVMLLILAIKVIRSL